MIQRFSEVPNFLGVKDILAIPKLKFYIKKVQSNGFSGITGKLAIPK